VRGAAAKKALAAIETGLPTLNVSAATGVGTEELVAAIEERLSA
jgi:hypothetical protein